MPPKHPQSLLLFLGGHSEVRCRTKVKLEIQLAFNWSDSQRKQTFKVVGGAVGLLEICWPGDWDWKSVWVPRPASAQPI